MKRDATIHFFRRTALIAVSASVAAPISILTFRAPAADATTQPADTRTIDDLAAIKSWFSDLASADGTLRDDALTNLMGLKSSDLPALKQVVEESRPLVPAQASVLRQIVTQVFLSGEHYEGDPAAGFLGIRMEQTAVSFRDPALPDAPVTNAGVVIVERMPGFAGARMLRDGDVILAILDRPDAPLRDPQDFALAVKDMGAGATVHFQVLRRGQVIRAAVKLDVRPLEANQGFGMNDLLERRRLRADEFWAGHFALLVKEGVS
jgi:hypothetical protein